MFTKNQSDFLPGNSRISQSLAIVHEIYISFDCNTPPDVRGTLLDISEAFEKFYEGLIFKLQTYGINGKLLNLMQDYLSSRQQQDLLNGQTFSSENILAGVLQGSVLGPHLVLIIYINDVPQGIKSI